MNLNRMQSFMIMNFYMILCEKGLWYFQTEICQNRSTNFHRRYKSVMSSLYSKVFLLLV